MIRFSTMSEGFVFRDPADLSDMTHATLERSWYVVVHRDAQKVEAKHVASGSPRKWNRRDCKTLIAASNEPACDTDLSCLIGRMVKVTCAHGIVTGRVRGFKYKTVAVQLGDLAYEIRAPVQLDLGEEPWSFHEIKLIELIKG